MAYPYITITDLNNRLGVRDVTRFFDDNVDGVADTGPVNAILADACSKVAGGLQGVYPLSALAANPPHEVIRLSLDFAEALCLRRHNEIKPGVEWSEIWKTASHDLEQLRKNAVSLDTDASPNPAANEGGELYPDPNTEDVYTFARDGFGDF
jgi:phage gp36-like protein